MILKFKFLIIQLILICIDETKSAGKRIKRKTGLGFQPFPAPYGPAPFAPFGLGPYEAYPDVPVLPPFGYPYPGPFPSTFPGVLPKFGPGQFGGPFPGGPFPAGPFPGGIPFPSPFPSAYPLPLAAPPPLFPSPYFLSPGAATIPPPSTPPAQIAPATTGPVIVSAKTAATLSLASIIHALIAKKFYPPIFPFPVPNPLPFGVPVRIPFPIRPNDYIGQYPRTSLFNKNNKKIVRLSEPKPVNSFSPPNDIEIIPEEIQEVKPETKPIFIPLHHENINSSTPGLLHTETDLSTEKYYTREK